MPETWEWERFRQLAEIEPRLMELYERAAAMRDQDGPSFCANAVWYGYGPTNKPGLRAEMKRLVGITAGDPEPTPAPMGIAECGEAQLYTMQDLVAQMIEQAPRSPVHPDLVTSEAYDVCLQVIWGALPDCRNCGCFRPGDER